MVIEILFISLEPKLKNSDGIMGVHFLPNECCRILSAKNPPNMALVLACQVS